MKISPEGGGPAPPAHEGPPIPSGPAPPARVRKQSVGGALREADLPTPEGPPTPSGPAPPGGPLRASPPARVRVCGNKAAPPTRGALCARPPHAGPFWGPPSARMRVCGNKAAAPPPPPTVSSPLRGPRSPQAPPPRRACARVETERGGRALREAALPPFPQAPPPRGALCARLSHAGPLWPPRRACACVESKRPRPPRGGPLCACAFFSQP
ncbi:proline-rich proteoglycan 2-like [Tachyglossus aculeatus]|uniref:proline-rich proteoglycan 2-like n=1 Tax=Tachyglossus aculeatus TaxID=9261 RepID=UPI0018F545DE|nr:proline-rich proteoglycan 2-like [Tachyglossus aculeatus]